MAHITANINLTTRPAIYTPIVARPHYNLAAGQRVRVDVFGIYQVADGEDVDAYFVITLPNGRCTYAGVTEIQFIDVGGDWCEQSTDCN